MQDISESEIHDFILKSYKELVRDVPSMTNKKIDRNVSIIEQYFIGDVHLYSFKNMFDIDEYTVAYITDKYLEHINAVARHGGYTSDEIDLISILLRDKCSKRRAFIECVETIAKCKNGSNQDKLVFNIDDPIEKLHELNLISKRTITCLHSEFEWSWDNSEHSRVITLADIVYVPKMFFYNVSYMGNKCVREIISFIDTYPIQGRIIPTKEDIKRVLDNASIGINIVDDNADIINMYFLSDMSIDDMCKRLHIELNRIHMYIERLFVRMCKVAYKNDWGLLDLITVSSMLDLHAVKLGTYKHRDYYTPYIAGRIRDLLSGNE